MQSNELLEQGHAPDAFDSFLDRQKTQRYEDLENHRGMAERQYVDGMHGILPREVAQYMHKEFVQPMKADGAKVGQKIGNQSQKTFPWRGNETLWTAGEIRAMPLPNNKKPVVMKVFFPDGRIAYHTNQKHINQDLLPTLQDQWMGVDRNMKFV